MGVKISELTSATTLTGNEEIPIVQSGNTKKAKINLFNEYSTTEKIVGTWIDGKPLYQIVVQDTLPTVSSGENSKVVTWGSNISYAFCVFAFYETSTGNKNMLPYVTTSNQRIVVIMGSSGDNNKLVLTSGSSGANGLTATIVIRYTKTTDNAS